MCIYIYIKTENWPKLVFYRLFLQLLCDHILAWHILKSITQVKLKLLPNSIHAKISGNKDVRKKTCSSLIGGWDLDEADSEWTPEFDELVEAMELKLGILKTARGIRKLAVAIFKQLGFLLGV